MSDNSPNPNDLSNYVTSEKLRDSFEQVKTRLENYHAESERRVTALYLTLIVSFMAGVRLLPWDTFVTSSKVYLSGNDGWYHLRQSMYVAKHWPYTMPYDIKTGYPVGTDAGTFGTLFDQIVGTIALIVGLGNPDQNTVALVLALTTVAFASLSAIPVYYITKEITTKSAGILGATILAALPGVFFYRGLFGNGDHQMAETFFLLTSVAAFIMAFRIARKNVFVLEVFSRETITEAVDEIKYSLLAGVAIGAYILVWPPGVIFFGAIGLFFAAHASIAAYQDDYLSEPTLLVGAVSMIVPTVFLTIVLDSLEFGAAGYTLLQLLLSVGVGVGCLFLIGLQRYRQNKQNDIPPHIVPGSVIIGSVSGLFALSEFAPDAFDKIMFNINRTLLLNSGQRTLTIAEAQQFVSPGNVFAPLFSQYGLLFFVAAVGFVFMLILTFFQVRQADDYTVPLFLLVFGLFVTLMAFTQVRFNYYLAPFVAIFAAYTIYQVLSLADLQGRSLSELQGYQYIIIIAVILVLLPGIVYPANTTVIAAALSSDSIGSYTAWEGPLEWTANNTPDDGIEQYGTYYKTEQPYKDQAPNAYGVVSWWDYGHWITVTGERAPVSNPFQQHATESAEYLLATNASEAEQSIQQLNNDTEVEIKYVYVDWQMISANSKFAAPVTWHPELNVSDTIEPIYVQDGRSVRVGTYMYKQRYYESLMVRLYRFHGSRASPRPIVVDYETTRIRTQEGPTQIKTFGTGQTSKSGIIKFNSMRQARKYVQNHSTAQIGGIGNAPPEPVEALEHYRLVKTSKETALQSRAYQASIQRTSSFAVNGSLRYSDFITDPSWVKVFQKVDGAKINGTGAPPNSTVTLVITLKNPAQGTKFRYIQVAQADKNGNFTMTVPYSTTGYDNWGPEDGYGNVEVKAIDSAKLYAVQRTITTGKNGSASLNRTYYAQEVHIPEAKVIGENKTPVTVTMEKVTREELQEMFAPDSQENNNSSENGS